MLFSLSISLRSRTFRLRSYTFRRGFRKKNVHISYVPIRSEQPFRSFRKNVPFFLRSYTFCATVSQNVHFCLRSYAFRATVSHFVVVALVYVPTRSVYVPTRSAVVFETICFYFIRSYTFRANPPQFD